MGVHTPEAPFQSGYPSSSGRDGGCVPVQKLPRAIAANSIHAKVAQSSISLSCDSRGQCTLMNEFHYYVYVFIFLVMDLGKKQAMNSQ